MMMWEFRSKDIKISSSNTFKITERRDLEGARFILFGKCFWNTQKTRKIIELWNANGIFISVDED
ncbi:hypothetical protein AKH11_13755 [Vibrio parahaemolyticus]|nr:hypothetical protein AKH11_13755 [Vibrio parahaemolyticus]OCP93400.1 hypothetical protein AKH09_22155 [Vibrio parahaemolyticus]